jgi:urea carboxylase
LRFFDQIRFYEVSAEELLRLREDFPRGRAKLRIEETTFSLKKYQDFLTENESTIKQFKNTQQKAFEEERNMWERTGLANFTSQSANEESHEGSHVVIDEDKEAVEAPIQGNLWKILAKVGDTVKEGETLAIVESMKMEVEIESPEDGVIVDILCEEGESIYAGKQLFILEPLKA